MKEVIEITLLQCCIAIYSNDVTVLHSMLPCLFAMLWQHWSWTLQAKRWGKITPVTIFNVVAILFRRRDKGSAKAQARQHVKFLSPLQSQFRGPKIAMIVFIINNHKISKALHSSKIFFQKLFKFYTTPVLVAAPMEASSSYTCKSGWDRGN